MTPHPTPTVSVIIPTYNRAKYIREAVDSVLAQTHVPEEIVVIDDGSTDRTSAILSSYTEPVRVIRQHNRGRSAARNAGLDAAQGEAILFLDSDDILLPTNVEQCLAALNRHPQAGVVYTDALIFDSHGAAIELYTQAMPGPRPSGMVLGELSRRCFLTISSMVRRRCLEGLRFDERMSHAEDYNFWRHLAARHPFHYIDEPLMGYRYHELMTVHTGLLQTLKAELQVQQWIMDMPEFAALPAVERSRSYCSHGAKNAVLRRMTTARSYFARAIRSAPLYPGGYLLGALGLLGSELLNFAIMKRRQLLGNQLGMNMGERALTRLGGSGRTSNPAFGRARSQLAAVRRKQRHRE